MSTLNNLTVLGAGVLGGQIAWHSAFKGKNVTVYDISTDALDNCGRAQQQYARIYLSEVGASEGDILATKSRLTFTTDLAAAVVQADLVIEAVPEVPAIKSAVYRAMADILPAYTLLATNSSTLLPSDFAADTGRPEMFCALHFGNGIWSMNLAEVMAHSATSRETLTQVTEFAIEIGMIPVPVRKEHNGYLLNSWLVPLLNAAQTLMTNGIGTPEDIDRTYMLMGSTIGPFGFMDMVGMKTGYDVLKHWGEELSDTQMSANAEYIKRRFLDNGILGISTNQGYYTYPDPEYAKPGFLDIPDMSDVPRLVSLIASS